MNPAHFDDPQVLKHSLLILFQQAFRIGHDSTVLDGKPEKRRKYDFCRPKRARTGGKMNFVGNN